MVVLLKNKTLNMIIQQNNLIVTVAYGRGGSIMLYIR